MNESQARRTPTMRAQTLGLVGFITVCYLAAGIGAALTANSVSDWYQTISKPSWTPPDSIFGPVWTVLYTLMAIAAWLVWRRAEPRETRGPLICFFVQLSLNVAWSGIFFGMKNPPLAFAEIVLLWLSIAATTLLFWRRSRLAGLLFVPYLAWSTFAAVLNFYLWRMNP